MIGAQHPSVHDIQCATAASFGIPIGEMTSQRRFRSVARPRQVAMFITRGKTPYSLPAIGRMFGNRDHTTVIHAIETVERLCADDPDFADQVRRIEDGLAPADPPVSA
jgi:chromosomal replication initiator protein